MGWGTHINPWLIHVNVWQKPLQYCKVISLQLIKINGGKKKHRVLIATVLRISTELVWTKNLQIQGEISSISHLIEYLTIPS